MSFSGSDIRVLRQRLGWSLAEMGRQMGCGIELIQCWESEVQLPDPEALNQLRYLRNRLESYSDHVARKPQVEKELAERRIVQLTFRDHLKDIQ
jgi:transcriptional regulator with XRE-family HTH domain